MTDKEIEHSHNNFVETLQDEQAIIPQIGLVQSSAIGEQTPLSLRLNEKGNLELTREYTLQEIHWKISDYENRQKGRMGNNDELENNVLCEKLFIDDFKYSIN